MVGEKPRQARIANRQLMLEVALKPVSLSDLDGALEWSGVLSDRDQAAIIFSLEIGMASRKVCSGVFIAGQGIADSLSQVLAPYLIAPHVHLNPVLVMLPPTI